MNTTFKTRFTAFALAAITTFAILSSVDGLASAEPNAAAVMAAASAPRV